MIFFPPQSINSSEYYFSGKIIYKIINITPFQNENCTVRKPFLTKSCTDQNLKISRIRL